MQMIYTRTPRTKKRKPTAKQRELSESWEAMLKKYATKTSTAPRHEKLSDMYSLGKPACRETPKIPSLNSGYHDCSKKQSPVYTGTLVKGIATMHKSNAIPIFSDEQAVEVATMRRG
jgi:hypothetical protein